jgi:hypothetical protein
MNPFSCMVNYIHILHKLVSNPPPPPPQIHFFKQPPPPPPPLMEAPINLFYHSISIGADVFSTFAYLYIKDLSIN